MNKKTDFSTRLVNRALQDVPSFLEGFGTEMLGAASALGIDVAVNGAIVLSISPVTGAALVVGVPEVTMLLLASAALVGTGMAVGALVDGMDLRRRELLDTNTISTAANVPYIKMSSAKALVIINENKNVSTNKDKYSMLLIQYGNTTMYNRNRAGMNAARETRVVCPGDTN